MGVALVNDGRQFWDDYGWEARSLVDIGVMMRFAFPEQYATSSSGVGLDRCVEHLLAKHLDKSLSTSNWRKRLSWDKDRALILCESQYIDDVKIPDD